MWVFFHNKICAKVLRLFWKGSCFFWGKRSSRLCDRPINRSPAHMHINIIVRHWGEQPDHFPPPFFIVGGVSAGCVFIDFTLVARRHMEVFFFRCVVSVYYYVDDKFWFNWRRIVFGWTLDLCWCVVDTAWLTPIRYIELSSKWSSTTGSHIVTLWWPH